MKKVIITLILSAFSLSSFSALPPRYQAQKDFTQIFSLLERSEYGPEALSGFKSLTKNDGTFTLVYNNYYEGETCSLTFDRVNVDRSFGWVGPAAPLEIKGSPLCSELK